MLMKLLKSTKIRIVLLNEMELLISRKKLSKSDGKGSSKDEPDASAVLAKVSVTSDVDDEKEKKKDRELLVK